jgi:hypothetical protein
MRSRHDSERAMTLFKYICAIVALIHLVIALLPTHFIGPHHSAAAAVAPQWIGRAVSAVDFLLVGTIFYGLQTRKPVYWRLIPVLLTIYLLSELIAPLWTAILRGLPWLPFLFIFVFIIVGMLAFVARWRKRRNYFV